LSLSALILHKSFRTQRVVKADVIFGAAKVISHWISFAPLKPKVKRKMFRRQYEAIVDSIHALQDNGTLGFGFDRIMEFNLGGCNEPQHSFVDDLSPETRTSNSVLFVRYICRTTLVVVCHTGAVCLARPVLTNFLLLLSRWFFGPDFVAMLIVERGSPIE
jgi:hypothetical protein